MKIQIGDDVREMTADERANYDTIIANAAKTADDRAAAIASARAKLAGLGLTADEIAALLGV